MYKIIKLINVLFFISISLYFSGCSQSKFNPYNKGIMFREGKPYNIPYNTYVGGGVFDYIGLNCKKNEIPWGEMEIIDFIKKNTIYSKLVARLNENPNVPQLPISPKGTSWKKAMLNNLRASKLIGCVSQMSDQEFKYKTGIEKQNNQFQHEQNIQSQKSLDKTLDRITPKTHNINIYHY